jgi:N-acyl-D-amino-acid deacylase
MTRSHARTRLLGARLPGALPLLLTLAACVGPGSTSAPAPLRSFDLLLRGGTIVDGTGRPAYVGDVGVIGGHVAAIGDLSRGRATTTLDVRGLMVAPGFVDIHSHVDARALPTAENMLRQGVTTEISGPDGAGPVAIRDSLAAAQAGTLAVNLGLYVGFNTVWRSVVGQRDRRPTAAETDSMRALVRRGLAEGAWGVSAGLDYKPAYFATTDEVVAVVEVARPWRTSFPNHDRLTPEAGFSSIAGMRETLEIGERAGLVPVFTHMKLQGHEQGHADDALRMLDSVAARGRFAAADVYPYLAGVTGLSALIIPGWAQDGGREAMLARFREPETRARVAREMTEIIRARFGSPANVHVLDRDLTLEQLVPALGVPTAADAVIRLLEERDRIIIPTFGSEADLVRILQHPAVAVACDCGASRTSSHPRYVGSYPRVLGRYVREQRALPWEAAVRKMTGLPAAIVGMVDRGVLAVGMAADIAVFDSATVIDRATYTARDAASEGVRYVVVNGRLALRDGAPTGVAAGRAIFRGGSSMPSRATSTDVARAAAVTAPGVTITLAQAPGERAASGRVRMAADGGTIEATALGVLQVARGWASITGRARVSGQELPFTLIVEERDPVAGDPSTATLLLPGQAPITRALPAGSVRVVGAT